ncbi:MAG TPA: hypothetical protein VGQ39_20570 [Pyrinomonadaceae bacterium]|jgi:hypothetical protein|nr:hypothetical protein [Pyrinomonadaceae bacterium]
MPKRNTPRQDQPALQTPKWLSNLFTEENRGLLLDIVVFIANIFVMRLFTRFAIELFNKASENDPLAKLLLMLACIGMWILPAAGAVLKRWHLHHRLSAEYGPLASEQTSLGGCLFNPIFYFCLNLVVMSAIVAALGQELVGKKRMDSAVVFVPSILIGLGLTIVQTYLIYQYFSPPKKPPRWDFLRTPQSELLGDVCLFLNMLLFQCAWNLLTFAEWGRVSSVFEFFGRLFILSFLALLVYFPPRMFYLAEDINKRRTWLTMLLANSPVIFQVLIGTNSEAGW